MWTELGTLARVIANRRRSLQLTWYDSAEIDVVHRDSRMPVIQGFERCLHMPMSVDSLIMYFTRLHRPEYPRHYRTWPGLLSKRRRLHAM